MLKINIIYPSFFPTVFSYFIALPDFFVAMFYFDFPILFEIDCLFYIILIFFHLIVILFLYSLY